MSSRLADMLRCYCDIFVAEEAARARIRGERLSPDRRQDAFDRGMRIALVEHDAGFVWKRRLDNTFDELREFVRRLIPKGAKVTLSSWAQLRAASVDRAVRLLGSNPVKSPGELQRRERILWWKLVAIIHEADHRTKNKL